MAVSFRTRLLVLFFGLVGGALIATITAVISATNENVKAIVNDELSVANRVFSSLLDENRRQLAERTQLLASDFAFKRAIATDEQETILSVLANHGDRIAADLVLLVSRSGDIMVSTHEIRDLQPQIHNNLMENPKGTESLAVVEGMPYQLVMVPVIAPDLIAWVGLGFEINQQLLSQLKDITKTDITLVYSDHRQTHSLSSIALDPLDTGATADNALEEIQHSLEKIEWLSQPFSLVDNPGQKIKGLVSISLKSRLDDYRLLRLQMIAIGMLAIGLAAVMIFFIARNITRPIVTLTSAARRIAEGSYNTTINIRENNEFGILSDAFNSMQSAISEREARISYQAEHDLLTGLPNRYQMTTLISELLTSAETAPAPFALCLLQLTSINSLRDLYGSTFSDFLLARSAQRLQNNLEPGTIARFADDQFLLLFKDTARDNYGDNNNDTGSEIASKLFTIMEPPFLHEEISLKLETRLGFVSSPRHGNQVDDLCRRAQIALASALESSSGFAVYAPGQDEKYLRKIKVTNRLIHAIETGDFDLHYQPKYDFQVRTVLQVEALLRWKDAELGPMRPDEFIPLAEQSGNITRITRWVLARSLKQLRTWQLKGTDLAMSINLSAQDIADAGFISHMLDAVSESAIEPSRLIAEVTESIVMKDVEVSLQHLHLLRKAGIRVSMDDFGTGYSSLAQLKHLPVDEIKIDKSFIQELDTDSANQYIVRSTISLAQNLGLRVVAEGLENAATMALLEKMGCDAVQGYHLARPMPLMALETWLETRQYEQSTGALTPRTAEG